MTSKKEIEAAETAIIALYITCDSYALEMAKAALEAAEKVRVDVATKREEKLIADNERYERKRYDASNVYAGLFRDFTTLTELLNKNIKREEKLREALEAMIPPQPHCILDEATMPDSCRGKSFDKFTEKQAQQVVFRAPHSLYNIQQAKQALQQED